MAMRRLLESPLFARKSIETAVAESERGGFRRALGPVDLTAIGIAAIIGAGIFALMGKVAHDEAGPSVIVSIAISGVAAVFAAISYAEFASMVPGSGSAYVYAYTALGRFPAFLMGWVILNAYAVGNMTVAIAWSEYFRDGLEGMGVDLSDALANNPFEGGAFNVPAALVMLLVTALCLPRTRESATINNVLVALKLFIVLFVIALGAMLVDPGNWSPFQGPNQEQGIITGAALVFFAYLGFDTVAATAEEARNPRRDLPLGIVLSVTVCMLLYMAMGAVVTGMAPSETLDGEAPVAQVFRERDYGWAAGIIGFGAVIALFTVLYAFQIALARILHAMARDGFLPTRFARLHPSTATPWGVTIWTGALAALGAGLLPLESVALMTVLASILVYVLVSTGVLVLKAVRPDAPRRFRAPWPVHAAGIGLMLALIVLGIDRFTHLVFLAWLGLGLMLYGFYAHRRAPVDPDRSAPRPVPDA